MLRPITGCTCSQAVRRGRNLRKFAIACVGLVALTRGGDVQSAQAQTPPSPSGVAESPKASVSTDPSAPAATDAVDSVRERPAAEPSEPASLVRLDPQAEVWVDAKRKRVIVGGQICLRKGLLEMFACSRGTKEHESIVAVNSKAYLVHTALLTIGARSGTPVQYDPIYKPATGTKIRVEVIWKNAEGNVVRRRAQEMIRNVKTRQPMEHPWVFAGSGFWEDEQSDARFYMAEGGELICLSNFSTAMLDLPIESPADNADLIYEAATENIPELGTIVRLVLSVEP